MTIEGKEDEVYAEDRFVCSACHTELVTGLAHCTKCERPVSTAPQIEIPGPRLPIDSPVDVQPAGPAPASAPTVAPVPAPAGALARAAPLLTRLLLAGAAAMVACTVVLLGVGAIRSAAGHTGSPPPAPPSTATTPRPSRPEKSPQLSPRDQLVAQADHDRPQVEELTDYWVPQLSSKKLGTVDDGRTYSYADIVVNHAQLASEYSSVLLVRSDDFASFTLPDYWVSVVGQGFATAADANAWCDAASLPADDCFAKRLTQSSSSKGNTVHR